jgi:hypothetical protein
MLVSCDESSACIDEYPGRGSMIVLFFGLDLARDLLGLDSAIWAHSRAVSLLLSLCIRFQLLASPAS